MQVQEQGPQQQQDLPPLRRGPDTVSQIRETGYILILLPSTEGPTSSSLSERGDGDRLIPARVKNKVLAAAAAAVRLERVDIIF